MTNIYLRTKFDANMFIGDRDMDMAEKTKSKMTSTALLNFQRVLYTCLCILNMAATIILNFIKTKILHHSKASRANLYICIPNFSRL